MSFPKRASAESAIHVGNEFISNRKVRVELNRAVSAVYGPTFGSWGAAPGSYMRQHRSALNRCPACGRLLLVIACAVLFCRRDHEKATSSSRSRHRDSLRLRRFNWPDFVHHGSREERSSCHSG